MRYVHTFICKYIYIYIYISKYENICIYVYSLICIQYVDIYICIHISSYLHIYSVIHVSLYTHGYMHLHIASSGADGLDCRGCPSGTFSGHRGATSAETCETCPAGTWSSQVGLVTGSKGHLVNQNTQACAGQFRREFCGSSCLRA